MTRQVRARKFRAQKLGRKKPGLKKLGLKKLGPKKLGPKKLGPKKLGPKKLGPKTSSNERGDFFISHFSSSKKVFRNANLSLKANLSQSECDLDLGQTSVGADLVPCWRLVMEP
jgi:hypothetical protein